MESPGTPISQLSPKGRELARFDAGGHGSVNAMPVITKAEQFFCLTGPHTTVTKYDTPRLELASLDCCQRRPLGTAWPSDNGMDALWSQRRLASRFALSGGRRSCEGRAEAGPDRGEARAEAGPDRGEARAEWGTDSADARAERGTAHEEARAEWGTDGVDARAERGPARGEVQADWGSDGRSWQSSGQ